MRISIVSTLLCDTGNLALGRNGPAGLSLNGQEIIDEADFIGAVARTFWHKGSEGVVLQFGVERSFTTLRQAQKFALLHGGGIPKEGLVTIEVGAGVDTEFVYLRNAVVPSAQVVSMRGTSVVVQYVIKGPFFESDIPEDEIPGEPEPGEEDLVTRRARVAIAAAQSSVTVIFSGALELVPGAVVVSMSRPAGSDVIRACVREDSITTNGFIADLSAATPDDTYRLHYIAIE